MKNFFKKIKYIIEYLVVLGIIKFARCFSIDKSADIFSYIGRRLGKFLPITKVARLNLERFHGYKNLGAGKTIDQIIDGLWDNFGRFIGEFPHTMHMTEGDISTRVTIEGLENIQELQAKAQPFFAFTGHFANWEFLLSSLLRLYPDFGVVYRKANNPYTDKIINHSRSREHITMIAKGKAGVVDLVRCIKSKKAIAMLVDQKMREGISVPFFGRPAMTAHAIARLALQFDYPIVPCQMVRTHGTYFKGIIHPPLKIIKTDDLEQDCYNIMLQINQMLEDWIVAHPEQWLWFHNRWSR